LSHLPPSVRVSAPLSKVSFRFLFRVLAVAIYWLDLDDWSQKRWGDYQIVLNSHFIEDHFCFLWTVFSQRAFGQKKHAKYCVSMLH
jgi:hypothetical protein